VFRRVAFGIGEGAEHDLHGSWPSWYQLTCVQDRPGMSSPPAPMMLKSCGTRRPLGGPAGQAGSGPGRSAASWTRSHRKRHRSRLALGAGQ
jgi:hypothetical protein